MYDRVHYRMIGTDFYGVLGVAKMASGKEIKAAYRKLATQDHTDRNSSPEAEAKFKDFSEATSSSPIPRSGGCTTS